MVKIEYANAYSEVLEILKYIPLEDYKKIPEKKIELYKKNANSEYFFNYDPYKTLEEQEVSEIAKGIIAILFRDYWATEEQREKIIAKQKYDRNLLEDEKRKKYNPDDIFNKNMESQITNNKTIIYKEKWHTKLLNFLKGLIKMNIN